MAMECINKKWCDLPPELLDVVGSRLDIPSDTWHMRSVCSSWRSAVPSRPPGFLNSDPIKFFGPNNYDLDENEIHCNLRVAKHTFFHLSPPSGAPGWVIKAEEHKPGAFHLFNPFCRTHLNKQLQVEANFKLDVTNVKVHELGYEYVLRNVVNVEEEEQEDSLYNMEHEKVALLTLNHPTCCNSEYALLSTHNTGKLLLYISNLKRWSFLDDLTLGYDDRSIFVNDWSLHYVDVMEHGGTFYAVTNSGRTVTINLIPDHNKTELEYSYSVTLLTKSIIGGDKKCLVKSGDDLLMVDVYTCPTPGARLVKVHAVEIFKLDTQQQAWVLVTDLGDRALFLSNHSSFSVTVTASSVPGCKPNSIYFHFKTLDNKDSSSSSCCSTEVDTQSYNNDDGHTETVWTRDEIGVFDFDKGIIGSLQEYLQDSQLFSWPPPAWLTLST